MVGGIGGTRGPDLTDFGGKRDANQRVLLHFTGIGTAPGSEMPGYQLSEQELRSLAAYLLSLKG
jgi:mono/diheme cytochrome c family protein